MPLLMERPRTVPAIPESERITTKDVAAFLEHANHKDRPITRTQLQRFLRQPDGPILPDEIPEIRRCPADWGAAPFANQGSVLAVAPSDELCVCECFHNEGGVLLHTGQSSSLLFVHTLSAKEGWHYALKILGFGKTGLPVVLVFPQYDGTKHRPLEGGDDPLPWQVYHGAELIAEGSNNASRFVWHPERGIAYVG